MNCVGENKAIDNIVALSTSKNQLMYVAGENIVVMNNDFTLSVLLSFLRTHVPITVVFFCFCDPFDQAIKALFQEAISANNFFIRL